MTKEWYKENGYKMGLNYDQNQIDRAEADVKEAYISRILPEASEDDEDVKRATADLAFLLLSLRNVFVTRSGAKEKTGVNSMTAGADRVVAEQAPTCKMRLEELRSKSGAVKGAKVRDICKIYFKSNYFYV